MTKEPVVAPQSRAWLVLDSGPLLGIRHPLGSGTTSVGRGPENDLVIQDPSVSVRHLEIRREGAAFHVRDLGSTNGTYLNGERIEEADLSAHAMLRLGEQGPQVAFVVDEAPASDLDRTQVFSKQAVSASPPPLPVHSAPYEALLSAAVSQARRARASGYRNQTMTIMRDTLDEAMRAIHQRSRRRIAILVAILLVISTAATWKIIQLRNQKRAIDRQIHQIETRLQTVADRPGEADRLISQLDAYQGEAEQLQRSLLFRFAVHEKEEFLVHEIRTLMAEFGAEVYSVPPEFFESVSRYVKQYQGPDRRLLEQALSKSAPEIQTMRRVLEEERLPADMAYIPLVESALAPTGTSAAGAAGLWQLTPPTARAYGLRVDGQVDERLDLTRATHASCRYLRDLILDFGSGSSVMLALAAYDVGPTAVKQAIARTVRDPIKQRDFWYLYRARALPRETSEYVPKVVAAMILGRNPHRFGF